MNLYLRLIITLIKACFRRRTIQFGEKTIWKGRVLPNDIDVYGHLNSGRYVTLAGLAAFDHVVRTGGLIRILKKGYLFVFNRINVVWKRPLGLFRRFSIETQCLYWEGRYDYVMAKFIDSKGEVIAEISYRVVLLVRSGKYLTVQEVLDEVYENPPKLPEEKPKFVDMLQ